MMPPKLSSVSFVPVVRTVPSAKLTSPLVPLREPIWVDCSRTSAPLAAVVTEAVVAIPLPLKTKSAALDPIDIVWEFKIEPLTSNSSNWLAEPWIAVDPE